MTSRDWENIVYSIIGMAAAGTVFTLCLSDYLNNRQSFMRECQDDNIKHYQCTALWRNGGGVAIWRNPLPMDAN